MLTGLTLAVLASCTADVPPLPDVPLSPAAATIPAERLDDREVIAVTDSSKLLRWTQVSDGERRPALYRLKYAEPAIVWATATIGCNAEGTSIGALLSCTVPGLDPGTVYDFQLMSYCLENGVWHGGTSSHVVTEAISSSGTVDDLSAAGASSSTLHVQWTQVDDGTGNPARYRVRYAAPPLVWSTAVIGCDTTLEGAQIGGPRSCTIDSLAAGSAHEVQSMSYHVVDGVWHDAKLSNVAAGSALHYAEPVTDLAIAATTDSSMTVRWTEVSDGEGSPASYRVKYAPLTFAWSTARAACGSGTAGMTIGAQRSCTIPGLSEDADYSVQVMSYRAISGTSDGETLSNLAGGRTAVAAQQQSTTGIWIGPAEVARLPTSGSAWTNLLATANSSCGIVDLADQDQNTNVCILAKALVFARTGNATYRTGVVTAITQIVGAGTYVGRALALGRELGAYVVAADLIDLKTFNPTLDASFRAKLRTLRTTHTSGAASDLIDCHERRPNNWGAMCGATRAAIAVYLGDVVDLARSALVLRGYLGNRAAYAGFDYGGPETDLTWQCDPARPVGINPAGCTRDGHSLDGVLPDDQRRAGSYTWPPPQENYVWEALQGLLAQAVILERAGYPVWDWEDRALLRAVRWVHNEADFPAIGDDQWQTHIVNRAYSTNFPAVVPARAGKNFGWTDWTHR